MAVHLFLVLVLPPPLGQEPFLLVESYFIILVPFIQRAVVQSPTGFKCIEQRLFLSLRRIQTEFVAAQVCHGMRAAWYLAARAPGREGERGLKVVLMGNKFIPPLKGVGFLCFPYPSIANFRIRAIAKVNFSTESDSILITILYNPFHRSSHAQVSNHPL